MEKRAMKPLPRWPFVVLAVAGVVTLMAQNFPGAPGAPITNSLSGTVALNNASNFFDGPSVAQGTVGTWCGGGTVTVTDTAAASPGYSVKLWDGTTVIASTNGSATAVANATESFALSGCLASPAANIKISVKSTSTTGLITNNSSSQGKDSTVTVWRVQ